MTNKSLFLRLSQVIGLILLLGLVLIGAAFAWLFATASQPRQAEDWSLYPPLPAPRGELATAVVHAAPCPEQPCPELERLFVLGGLGGLMSVQDAVTVYDPAQRQWSAAAPLPAPRHHLAAAGLGQAVYVSGGAADVTPPWRPETTFWRLDVGSNRWQALPPMPEGRWGHRMVAHRERLYVVGGHGPSSRVLIYSAQEGWRTGAVVPVPRDHISAVVAGDRIWVIGGRSNGSLSRVDIYDPGTDRWTPGPDLPLPTSGAAEGTVGGLILIFGGEDPDMLTGQVYDRHWMLDLDIPTPAWRLAPKPPLAVHGADGEVFQGNMVIAGGATRHGALSVTAWTDAVQRLDASSLGHDRPQ